jgi:hypothetical protein
MMWGPLAYGFLNGVKMPGYFAKSERGFLRIKFVSPSCDARVMRWPVQRSGGGLRRRTKSVTTMELCNAMIPA